MTTAQSPEWESKRGTVAAKALFDHLVRCGETEKEFKIVEGPCCFTLTVLVEKNNLCAKTVLLKK